MQQQAEFATSFLSVLKPDSFPMTTKRRQRQHRLERVLGWELVDNLKGQANMLNILNSEIVKLEDENIRVAGMVQSDYGKANFVLANFITVLITLLVIVSTLNTNNSAIRSMDTSQWTLSSLLAILMTTVIATIGYLGERIYEGFTGAFEPFYATTVQELPRRSATNSKATIEGGIGVPKRDRLQRDLSATKWRGTAHYALRQHILRKSKRLQESDSEDD